MKHKHKMAYLKSAEAFAECSVGERLRVGAIITKAGGGSIAEGYNGLPTHMDGPLEDEDGVTKPEVRHAEKNALLKLTRSNESSVGGTMFCTHPCCVPCAVDIVDAGILEFYFKDFYRDLKGVKYLLEAGVKVFKYVDGKFCPVINLGGENVSIQSK